MHNENLLEIGSIWKSKKTNRLCVVLYITNLNIKSPKAEVQEPQVVFYDGKHVLSTLVDRFLSIRSYVRIDNAYKNSIFNTLTLPVAEYSIKAEEKSSSTVKPIEEDNDSCLADTSNLTKTTLTYSTNTTEESLHDLVEYTQSILYEDIVAYNFAFESIESAEKLSTCEDQIIITINDDDQSVIEIEQGEVFNFYQGIHNGKATYCITIIDSASFEDVTNEDAVDDENSDEEEVIETPTADKTPLEDYTKIKGDIILHAATEPEATVSISDVDLVSQTQTFERKSSEDTGFTELNTITEQEVIDATNLVFVPYDKAASVKYHTAAGPDVVDTTKLILADESEQETDHLQKELASQDEQNTFVLDDEAKMSMSLAEKLQQVVNNEEQTNDNAS